MADDRLLVEATLRGEMEAFGQLVRRYQQPLIASARQLIRRAEDAEDLAQETLLSAYQRLRQLRDRNKFRAWLFTILRHKCLDYLRSYEADEYSLESYAEIPVTPRECDGDELVELLQRLPFADREVLAARYLHELEYEEIAQALGCSIRAARMRCQRARERLRTLMLQADEEETRRTLQRAMGALTAGLMGDTFVDQVLQGVKPLDIPSPPAAGLPKPPMLHLPAAHLWLSVGGWKVLAGVLAALTLAGISPLFHSSSHMAVASSVSPRLSTVRVETGTTLQPQPVVQHTITPLHAAGDVEQSKAPRHISGILLTMAGKEQTFSPARAAPIERPQMVFSLAPIQSYIGMVISADGTRLATMTCGNEVTVWNLASGQIEGEGRLAESGRTGNVHFSKDSRFLQLQTSIGQPYNTRMIWDIAAWHAKSMTATIPPDGFLLPDGKHCLAVTPLENAWVPSATYDLSLCDVDTGKEIHRIHNAIGLLQSVSDDGSKVAIFTGSEMKAADGKRPEYMHISIWDLYSGQQVAHLTGLPGSPGRQLFSPDGEKFAAIVADGQGKTEILLWNVRTGALLQTLSKPANDVDAFAFSSDGRRLATGGGKANVTVWDVESGKALQQFADGPLYIRALCFTPDGKELIVLPCDGQHGPIMIIDLATTKSAER